MENQIGLTGTQEMARQKKENDPQLTRPYNLMKPYNGPPYLWKVLVEGKWIKMSGFDKEHIQNQLGRKQAKKVVKIKEKI